MGVINSAMSPPSLININVAYEGRNTIYWDKKYKTKDKSLYWLLTLLFGRFITARIRQLPKKIELHVIIMGLNC